MNLECYYDFPYKGLTWSIPFYFDKSFKALKSKYSEINFTPVNNHLINIKNTAPCYMMNHHWFHLRNPKNKKFITVSLWDQLKCAQGEEDFEIFPDCWEQVITSAGVFNYTKEYTPFTYILPHTHSEIAIQNIRIDNSLRTLPDKLNFRGKLYGERLSISRDTRFNVINEHNNFLDYGNFLKEINKYSVNLSLNGASEICYRDMEILGMGSALFREKLKTKFHNELKANYHYIAFEVKDGQSKTDSMFERWEEIKKDTDFINFVSNNGLKWYNENVTYENFTKILLSIIDINKLT